MTAIDRFLDLEDRHALFNMTYEGINWWQFIRSQTYWKLYQALQGGDHTGHAWKSMHPQPPIGHIIRHSIGRHSVARIRPADVLFLNGRRFRINGSYKCVYGDDLLPYCGRSFVTLERPRPRHLRPALHTETLFYADYYLLKTWLGSLAPSSRRSRCLNADAHDIELLIRDTFGVDVALNIADELASFMQNHAQIKGAVVDLLQRVQPKVVVLVSSESILNQVLISECRRRDLLTIEMQHSTMESAAYNFPTGVTPPTLPDYIFMYGRFWKEVTLLPQPDEKKIAIGFPFMDWRMTQVASSTIPTGPARSLLVVGSPGVDEILLRMCVTVKRLHPTLRILYRRHPIQSVDWERSHELIVRYVDDVLAPSRDIYDTFSRVDTVLSGPSAVVYEALRWRLRVILFARVENKALRWLIEKKAVISVQSGEECAEALSDLPVLEDELLSHLWEPSTPERTHQAFKYVFGREGV